MLVKNEDAFIEQVIGNILAFCDKILFFDNGSTDKTYSKIRSMADLHPKMECHQITDTAESQTALGRYINTPSWVFGVDGDEIYDPVGLCALRHEVISGKYDDWWAVFGNVVNCVEFDREKKIATGYAAPPSRSMTKLYNFNAITAWNGNPPQRLHGGRITFKKGYDECRRLELYKQKAWNDSHYRCLHMCFVPRSSRSAEVETMRLNVTEDLRWGIAGRIMRKVSRIIGVKLGSKWKRDKYMKGELVSVDASSFFPPSGTSPE